MLIALPAYEHEERACAIVPLSEASPNNTLLFQIFKDA